MHLRISALLCCAILAGFATTAQSNTGFRANNDDGIDIDDLEGSGKGGKEVSNDLESSGSGSGPDDEDAPIPKTPDFDNRNVVVVSTTTAPSVEVVPKKEKNYELQERDPGVSIMNPKPEDRPTSFFAQPGILAAVIGGAVVGLLCAILVVMFIVYRMRKKDEGSYALDEPKRSPNSNSYSRGTSKEFFA